MEFVFEDAELFRYSDSELSRYISSLTGVPGHGNVVILSSKYIAKGHGYEEEVENNIRAMKFASQLGIPIPQVHRIISIPDGFSRGIYYIMDRIPGITLEEAWPKLGWIKSIRLAFQLRYIIRRLRTQTSRSCGILESGECMSFFLNDKYGLPPNANANQVNAFLNFWVNFTTIGQEVKKTPEEHAICPRPVFTSTRPFVFTHHDMAPRNLIVDPQGKLWVVDWESAGYYPECFEYAGMCNFFTKKWTKFMWWRWRLFTWIAAGGFYDKERAWLQRVEGGLLTRRLGRRFNILAKGYAVTTKWPAV